MPFRIDFERTLKRGSESKPQLPSSLWVMARFSMWSALACFFCSAHVGTGSETTVKQESQQFILPVTTLLHLSVILKIKRAYLYLTRENLRKPPSLSP